MLKKIALAAGLLLAYIHLAMAWPGNYHQTCRKCYTSRGVLYCRCQKRNQSWRHTRLARPAHCHRIRNNNGHLTCIGRRPHPVKPHPVKPHHNARWVRTDRPIMDNDDAPNVCPKTCGGRRYWKKGQWRSDHASFTSTCLCYR